MPASASSSAICFRRSMRSGTSGLLPSRSVGPLPDDQHDARHLLRARSRSAAAGCRRAWRRRCRRSAPRAAWCPWRRSAARCCAQRRRWRERSQAISARRPIIRAAREHPSAARCRPLDDMDMEMEHDLAAVGAVVGDHAIAVRLQPELAAPPCRRRARSRRSVSAGAVALKSALETYSPLGITSTCTGACGWMSWKASANSSS